MQTFSRVSFEEVSKGNEALHMGQAGSFLYFTVCVYTPSMPVYLNRHHNPFKRSPETADALLCRHGHVGTLLSLLRMELLSKLPAWQCRCLIKSTQATAALLCGQHVWLQRDRSKRLET